jgi:threonine aldolase
MLRGEDIHFARTKLVQLENTHTGKAQPVEYFKKWREFSKEMELKLHLDGARLFNACAKYGVRFLWIFFFKKKTSFASKNSHDIKGSDPTRY